MKVQNVLLVFAFLSIPAVMGSQIIALRTMVQSPVRQTMQRAPASNSATCVTSVPGIKSKIEGHGRNSDKAFEDAATQCFEKLSLAQGGQPGRQIAEDVGMKIIDTCANIQCQN